MEKSKLIRLGLFALISLLALLAGLFDDYFNFFMIFVCPVLPIIYGYITRNKTESILIGVLPFLVWSLSSLDYSIINPNLRYPIWWILRILASVGIITGIEGYFAARRGVLSLLIAVSLCILWYQILLCGFH